MRAGLRALWAYRFDAVVLVGGGAIAFGITTIYPPAGWIAGGLMLVIWGIIGSAGLRPRKST